MRKVLIVSAFAAALSLPQSALVAQGAQPIVISVQLSSFKFSPGELTMRHGQAYRLHLVNASGGGHNFSAPEFFAASDIAAANRGAVVDGTVKLGGHAVVDITLTPEKAGAYELRCTHFMHSSMGMTGRIVVE